MMKIAILGLGSVALADALALARQHDVVMTGPVPDRIEAINRGDYALRDPMLGAYCAEHTLSLRAVPDIRDALRHADMVFISAPLARDPESGALYLEELDSRIDFAARANPLAPIVVRSAVPVGYCDAKRVELKGAKIVYAPEFCRNDHMLTDILRPQFLIVGDPYALGRRVAAVLAGAALMPDLRVELMDTVSAELTRHLAVETHPACKVSDHAPALVTLYQPKIQADLPEELAQLRKRLVAEGVSTALHCGKVSRGPALRMPPAIAAKALHDFARPVSV